MTEGGIIDFPSNPRKPEVEIRGVGRLDCSPFNPAFLFFQSASAKGLARLRDHQTDPETGKITCEVTTPKKGDQGKLEKMYQIAVANPLFSVIDSVQRGDIFGIYRYSNGEPQPQLTLRKADEEKSLLNRLKNPFKPKVNPMQNLKDLHVDSDRIYLSAYERWDETLEEEDIPEDKFSQLKIIKDCHDIAQSLREMAVRPYTDHQFKLMGDHLLRMAEIAYMEATTDQSFSRIPSVIFTESRITPNTQLGIQENS